MHARFECLQLYSTPQNGQSKKKRPLDAIKGPDWRWFERPLERELSRQLNPPRPAAAQERVSYAHVASCCNGIASLAHFTVPAGLKPVKSRIGNECRQEGIRKVRVIQHIEEFGAELHIQPLSDRCGFIDRQVPLFECRSVESVTAEIAEMSRTRNAIGGKARRCRL